MDLNTKLSNEIVSTLSGGIVQNEEQIIEMITSRIPGSVLVNKGFLPSHCNNIFRYEFEVKYKEIFIGTIEFNLYGLRDKEPIAPDGSVLSNTHSVGIFEKLIANINEDEYYSYRYSHETHQYSTGYIGNLLDYIYQEIIPDLNQIKEDIDSGVWFIVKSKDLY